LAKLRANGIDAQMTVINAGSVRKDLMAGDLSVGDVYEMCPYENSLVALELTGQQIKDQLEQAVAGAHENASEGTGRRFPYVGGLRYTADMTEGENQRITSIEVRTSPAWEPLDLTASYVVGTVSFLARGGDGYDVFKEAMGSRYDSGFIDADAFVDYAEANTPLSQPEDTGITYIPPPS
jgi:5'-nucleotidase